MIPIRRKSDNGQVDVLITCDIAQRDHNKNMRAIELARVCDCACKAVRLFVVVVVGGGGGGGGGSSDEVEESQITVTLAKLTFSESSLLHAPPASITRPRQKQRQPHQP
jgi:hypothetical protein